MPRKGNVVKRDVLPDPIYNTKLVTKLINKIMIDMQKLITIKNLLNTLCVSGTFKSYPQILC